MRDEAFAVGMGQTSVLPQLLSPEFAGYRPGRKHLKRWSGNIYKMQSITENLQPDVSYRVRQQVGPWFTQFAERFGEPEFRLRESEYVGTIQQPLDEFTETLQKNGFEWDPLAWYHQPPVGSEPHGSWTYRQTLLGDRQIHTILIAHSPEYIDVFAHEEYSWIRHPIKHFQQVGIRRKAGSSEMRKWIRNQGIDIDTKSRRRRRISEGIIDLSRYFKSIIS